MEIFAEILKDLIEKSGLSLRKIATLTGISSSQLSRYLKNTIPNTPNAIILANFFHCSLNYLFGLTNVNDFKPYNSFNLKNFLLKYQTALKSHNLSHFKFCQNHNLNESSLRHWQNGETPTLCTIIKIADALDVSIDYLIDAKH